MLLYVIKLIVYYFIGSKDLPNLAVSPIVKHLVNDNGTPRTTSKSKDRTTFLPYEFHERAEYLVAREKYFPFVRAAYEQTFLAEQEHHWISRSNPVDMTRGDGKPKEGE